MDSANQFSLNLPVECSNAYNASFSAKEYDWKVKFEGRICIIGCGSISTCLQPLMLRHFDMDFAKMTIVDMKPEVWGECMDAGAKFLNLEITKTNFRDILGQLVGAGDILIDLAWNVDTVDVISWCQENNIRYLNTSIEVWEPYLPNNGVSPEDDTIYARHVRLGEFMEQLRAAGADKGATAIIEHGANPGLVSHWTKLGLEHIAEKMLATLPLSLKRRSALEKALESGDFAKVASLTGTKVIHISERDSQTSSLPIDFANEFACTWSVESFYQESVAPAELAWGTHENKLPFDAVLHKKGPKNKIYLERNAMDALVRSWVPSGEIVGQISAHGECFTISRHLTVKTAGTVTYQPSVYFVYRPCDIALGCIQMVAQKDFALPENMRVMNDEIVNGRDEVGVLLLGHDLNGWWVGSRLDIHETRKHVTGHNATTLQVAASALAALVYLINNPNEGVCAADDLPHKEVLAYCNQYLGECVSVQSDWDPAASGHLAMSGHVASASDKWTFDQFAFDPASLEKVG